MHNNPVTCDPDWIELFLQQKLTDQEQAAFESHLDDCNECRRRLEVSAAGVDVWSEVRDSLRGQCLSPDSSRSAEVAGNSATGDSTAGVNASFNHTTVLNLLAPTDDDRMLGRLGTYEVVGVIGSGGMGVVLKAFDAALNRYVAIKVLAPHLSSIGAARKRFAREAQAAAAVVHDNVMDIYGVAEMQGLSYLVMPYVRGPSLQRRLDDDGPLALVEILRIGMQAANGLAAAHAQGLVHRDVKPANILLADGVDRVKLTDFGLARAADDASLTKTGVIAGTPQYMSPEQARGESIGQRSDLFSLGSVLYAMCTGRAPFRAETSYGVLRRITDEEPRPICEINPDIPPWLCRIIARLMSKQPDDRFKSAQEVSELLEGCLAHVQQPSNVPLPAGVPATNPTIVAPASLPRRGSARWMGKLVALLVLGSGGIAAFLMATSLPPDISGEWTGDEWGRVVVKKIGDTLYTGSYSDTLGKDSGEIRLKWSRIERRYNGTWRDGDDRSGEISLRLIGAEIRGAWSTDRASRINSGTPHLSDLLWNRIPAGPAAEVIEKPSAHDAEGNLGAVASVPLSDGDTSQRYAKLWNQFGVTPEPVAPLTAKILEWIGLHLRPITKAEFREKNVFAKYSAALDVTFVRVHGPAEKAGAHEADIVVGLQGRPLANLANLDAAMQVAMKQIESGDVDSLQFEVLRNGETARVNVPLPARELDLRTDGTDVDPTSNAND